MTNPSSPASEGAACGKASRASSATSAGTGAAAVAISYHFNRPPFTGTARPGMTTLETCS